MARRLRGLEMKPAPKWQYGEMNPCGVDFTDVEEVVAYDLMHQKFRDYAKLSEEIVQRLGLGSGSIAIDIGSGTGAFALHAARTCRTVMQLIYQLQCSNTAGNKLKARVYPI